MDYPQNIRHLIKKISELPTIGPKTAERIVLHLLSQDPGVIEALSRAILDIRGSILLCQECGNFSDRTLCSICADPKRDRTIICVVAKAQDIMAIEKTKNFSGLYHLLGGMVNPLEGVHLEKLRSSQLVARLQANHAKEVILAFNSDIEGETTILALTKLLTPLKLTLSRLARGLPMGSDIEYADEITLGDALKGRKKLQ